MPTCIFNLIITRWSHWSSNIVSCGKASICCLIACAIAGTKLNGFKSKSSHNTSANCSGVIRLSEKKNLFYYIYIYIYIDMIVYNLTNEDRYKDYNWYKFKI